MATYDDDVKFLNKFVSEQEFPVPVYIFIVNDLGDENGSNYRIGEMLGKIEGAAIYRK